MRSKYQLSRGGFARLAEPIRVFLMKTGNLDLMAAANLAGQIVTEIEPVVDEIIEEALEKDAAPAKSPDATPGVCPTCNGTGDDPTPYEANTVGTWKPSCPTCNGSGRVSDATP